MAVIKPNNCQPGVTYRDTLLRIEALSAFIGATMV
jgi:hypothetical protein